MKKKIAVLAAVAIVVIALSMGCVDETTTIDIDPDDTLSSQNQKNQELKVTKTIEETFWSGGHEKIVIIGRLIEITFNNENPDVFVFQDRDKKAVFCARRAETFYWIIGETYKVTIREEGFNKVMVVIDAEMINDTQTQSAG